MKTILGAACLAAGLIAAAPAQASERLKPFVLISSQPGDMAAVARQVSQTLTAGGFEVVGGYNPYPGAQILVVTSEALRQAAARSPFGGYGAVQRVAVTAIDGQVQVSHTEPRYMAAAYRMPGDGSEIAGRLRAALGSGTPFGSAEGMTAAQLREYHYMFGMEYFTDPDLLAEYDSQEQALAAVEKNLAAGVMGVTKVYRVDIPGKAESVFGIASNGALGGGNQQDDAHIMASIDFRSPRSTAHLPYEMLVSGGKVYSLSARFRIAINFPDLSMMGTNSFMSIMGAPDAIRTALTRAAGGKVQTTNSVNNN